MDNRLENNLAVVSGFIATPFTYNHEVFGEKFYSFDIVARRGSGTCDVIPCLISERLLEVTRDFTNQYVSINGQFRSKNKERENGTKCLSLSLFVRNIEFTESCEFDRNDIFLEGYICKTPFYRVTPLGREIADLLLAVNRPYGKSDYVPCILWGRNARYVETLPVGTKINLWGRIQSRDYNKRVSDEDFELRTAYEVSVSRIAVTEE